MINKQHIKKYLLLIILLCFNNLFANDESILNTANNIFNALDTYNFDSTSTSNIHKLLKSKELDNKKVIPFYLSDDTLLIILFSNNTKYIVGKSKNQSIKGNLFNNKIQKNYFIFTAKEFDKWILSNPNVLNTILSDINFLSHWLKSTTNKKLTLPELQALLFEVKTPLKNYSLASVVGEDKFFPDITKDDKELVFMNLEVIHFTKLKNRIYYYSKIQDTKIIKQIISLLNKFYPDKIERELFINAFNKTIDTSLKKSFNKKNLLMDVKSLLDTISVCYDISNIDSAYYPQLSQNIINFLISNGISSIKDLKKANEDIKLRIAELFFSAKTTSFFRDWNEIKHISNWFEQMDQKCSKESRPLKLKVFGCSTGQEVISYAVELLEQGINNFKILGSDIDSKVISEAIKMTYSKDKFYTLPMDKKKHLLENYFYENKDGYYELKYKKVFTERIQYIVQDITSPLNTRDVKKEFMPPYDLISVKNILLYLDNTGVNKALNNINNVLNASGILFLKDKIHQASRLPNTNYFKNYIGISNSIIYKIPLNYNENNLLEVYNLFKNNPHPKLLKFFSSYSINKSYKKLSKYFLDLCDKDSNENIYSKEILFLEQINNNSHWKASNTLKELAFTVPEKFIVFYNILYNQYPNNKYSIDSGLNTVLNLYNTLSTVSYKEIPKNINKTIEKFKSKYKSNLSKIVLAHALANRDLARFKAIKITKKGIWIQKAIELLYDSYISNPNIMLLDHLSQILANYIRFYQVFLDKDQKQKIIKPIIDILLDLDSLPFSTKGKLSTGKLLCYFIFTDISDVLKIKYLKKALKVSQINEKELNILSDTWYADYYFIRSISYSNLIDLKKNLKKEELLEYINNGIKAIDKYLEIRSIYAPEEIKLRDKLLKQRESLI